MRRTNVVRMATGDDPMRRLYQRIGDFLFEQRLQPDPANYAFAHHLLADPDGPLAQAVAALTDGGVRLTNREIEALGCDLPDQSGAGAVQKAQGLVAQTQLQVEGFQDMVSAMRAETEGFGRDLAERAEAIRRADGGAGTDVGRVTVEMLARVRQAETRLQSATREAEELRSKLEEARDNARRDPLTGLPNRRAFEEAFAAQAAGDRAMCIAVCDVDHFKSVNDRFGHVVGDRVLKALAQALSDACAGHLVARYGGEEFVILFTDTDRDAALKTLEAARSAVATRRYRLRESDAPLGEITFSAGLSAARPGEGLGSVFHRADQLCYAAKANGRNCLRFD